MQLNVDSKHLPSDCPRPRTAVNMMLADLNLLDDAEEADQVSGDQDDMGNTHSINSFNTSNTQMNCDVKNLSYKNFEDINFKVLNLKNKCTKSIRKEYSPKLRLSWNGSPFEATIDEGSELNCVCSSLVNKIGLKFSPISLSSNTKQ